MDLLLVFTFILSLSFCSAKTTAAYDDEKCKEQASKIADVKKESFIHEKEFTNETRTSVLLSWSTADKESLILVTIGPLGGSSEIYISHDTGATFNSITSNFDDGKINIVKAIGLQRNTYKPEHVMLVSEKSTAHYIWISMNDGKTWIKNVPNFLFGEAISFNEKNPLHGLVRSTDGTLYGTTDGGATWTQIQKNTEKYVWSSHESDKPGSIYILRRIDQMGIFSKLLESRIGVSKDMLKVDGHGATPRVIYKNVVQFSAHGKFLFVSEQRSSNPLERHMKVSTDGGKTFEEVQLPSITPDRFYAVLDMSEDLIFMHVDNPGDTGHGILYTSGSDGTLYSQSLDRHLYPNFLSITDFYRVLSMRGTYLTTKMNKDNSMHTVISFNRGAEWRSLPKPINVNCPNGLTKCSLQISSAYSRMNQVMQVQTHLPLSSKSAPGIIMVHGHTHKTLQTSPPDVYVTSDGGYSWYKALDGPHLYQIADNGGLLVAVGDDSQNIVKFSTDEGRCWHHYKFTENDFQVTGVLTEPNNKVMKVIVWGFGRTTHKWRVYTIDLSKVVTQACLNKDYEAWVPHANMPHKAGTQWQGCLLGVKEKFMRLKKDSWCSNGKAYESKSEKQECPCTVDDYECEYGFSRPINSQQCAKDNNIIALDACIKGELKKIVSKGYRLLPGDKCDPANGFKPDATKQVALNKHCGKDEQGTDFKGVVKKSKPIQSNPQKQTAAQVKKTSLDKSKFIWIACGVCLALIVCVLLAVVLTRYWQIRKRDVSLKFSLLTDAHENDFSASMDADLLDAGVQKSTQNGARANGVEGKTNAILRSYHDDSDVDILE